MSLTGLSHSPTRPDRTSSPAGRVQLLPGLQGTLFCSLLISNAPVLFCGSSRPLEQTESKVVYSEFERPEPSSASDEQNWASQENRVQVGKTDANTGTISPTAHGEAGMKTLSSRERSLGISLQFYSRPEERRAETQKVTVLWSQGSPCCQACLQCPHIGIAGILCCRHMGRMGRRQGQVRTLPYVSQGLPKWAKGPSGGTDIRSFWALKLARWGLNGVPSSPSLPDFMVVSPLPSALVYAFAAPSAHWEDPGDVPASEGGPGHVPTHGEGPWRCPCLQTYPSLGGVCFLQNHFLLSVHCQD